MGVFVGVTDGPPTCNTIELAFAPEPQLQVYVPGVAPKVANVVELNVVVPLINEPDTYPDQTGNTNKILKTDGTSATWTDAISIASGTVSADLTVGDQAFVGPGAATFAGNTDANLTNPAMVVRFDNNQTQDSFAQIAFQNDDPTP